MVNDAASLDNLQDIVVPQAVAWWPPAPGWYGVALLTAALAGWLVIRWLGRWRRDAYRREALKTLARLRAVAAREGAPCSILTETATLLRRVALSAYPRHRVVPLSGEAWLDFLDETGGGGAFASGAGRVLLDAAYRSDDPPPPGAVDAALSLAESWIRFHRRGGG